LAITRIYHLPIWEIVVGALVVVNELDLKMKYPGAIAVGGFNAFSRYRACNPQSYAAILIILRSNFDDAFSPSVAPNKR
jgi:hypothetical protein